MSTTIDLALLKELCALPGLSGNEVAVRDYIINYVQQHQRAWAVQPQLFYGPGFQDCLIMVFGQPRTAFFAHMDTVGFHVRYDNYLVPVGGPDYEGGTELWGQHQGQTFSTRIVDEELPCLDMQQVLPPGTELYYKQHWQADGESISSCYLDDRLGIYVLLKTAETMTSGALVFSCWEEHGGGSVPYLARFLQEKYGIAQAIICDITWATQGVHLGKGVALSMRDRNIPRRSYLNRIIELAQASGVTFQMEVEGEGSSDGRELQVAAWPWDWLFIGVPSEGPHTPHERVNVADVEGMLALYRYLAEHL